MSWTPHTREELMNAGATFGVPDTVSGGTKIIVTGGEAPGSGSSSDPYGGLPLNINSGNSASGLNSIAASLGSGFEGLYNLIMQNTDKNNAFSAAQAQRQMDFQERMNGIAMDFNSLEAQKNRDWQEMMSNTAHQREIADLQAAGLNPVLSASGGNGAAVGSGATASGVTSAGAKGEADTSANGALVSLYGALINAQTQMSMANLSAQTNLAIADKQAAASMYGAQLAAEAAKYSNPYQFASTVLDHMFGDDNSRGSGVQRVLDIGTSGAGEVLDTFKRFFYDVTGKGPSDHSKSTRSDSAWQGKF